MNETKIRRNIRKLLFEDNWVADPVKDNSAGIFDFDDDSPIDPEPQMAQQLSMDRPPIDDEEYIPSSSLDLARAAFALFEDLPTDQIEFVYKHAHRLRAAAEERSKNFKVADPKIDDVIPLTKPVRKSTKQPEENSKFS